LQKFKGMGLVVAVLIFLTGTVMWMSGGDNHGTVDQGDSGGAGAGRLKINTSRGKEAVKQYTVELTGPLGPEERSKLESVAEPGGALGGNGVLVRAKEGRQDELAGLPFVKSVREYHAKQKISRELKSGGESKKIRITVTLFSEQDKPAVTGLVQNLGGKVLDARGRYLRVELNEAAIEKLAASPGVMYMEEDEQPEFLNDRARDIVGARPLAVPEFITRRGLAGEGQTIGLADSGLDTGSMGNLHPDLESPPGRKPRVIMLKSWAGVETPADTVGHGTHMAGTMVGSGKASGGKYAGLAPGASLYFQGIVDEEDNLAPPLDLRELFQPAYEAGVRVHVNGWGRKQNTYNSSAAQIDKFVFNHPGFLAVFAAGNSGPQVGSLTSEANSKNALTVGASMSPRPAFDNVAGDTNMVAGFSSRGPAEDGRIKPELVAPGTNIISAASRVVKESLPGRPEYTSMQGTSMASAVAGGAAALLRQYFRENAGIEEPSAALMKATLINGARRLDGVPAAAGFGLLDIGSTVMALENRLFEPVDNKEGLSTGESITLEREVIRGGAPFKATLAWTDPPAVPGSRFTLVNDLDLEVIAPGGEKYYGNDFSHQGMRDGRNNVEQVYIPDPEPGVYKIIVKGKSVVEDTSRGKGVTQDYALVFGRPPARGVVSESTGDKIILAGGGQLSTPENISVLVNNELLPGEKVPPAGAELYLAGSPEDPRRAYAVALAGRVDGVKALVVDNTTVLVRVNPEYREGGYAIDSRAGDVLILYGRPVDRGQTIPPGVSVKGYVNPHSQTIWKAEITSREESGVLAAIDRENRRIKLLDNQKTYSLAEQASVSFTDIVVDGDPADLPFGASTAAGLEKLLPGMLVHIALGSDDKVYHLSVKRYMVTGRVTGTEPGKRTLSLSSGGEYHVMPGIKITRDGAPAGLEDIKEGDLAMLNLVPGSAQVLSLTVYSNVSHGRVIYTENDTLYLVDNNDGFDMLRFHPEVQVFRWGMASGTSILNPGQWVRVVKNPVSGEVWRVDIAEVAGKIESVFDSYVPGTKTIKTADGNTYRLSLVSEITKNEIPVKARDLLPGEPVTVTALYGPGGEKIVVALEAETREGVQPPELKVKSTLPFEEFSLVSGITTASRLYARYRDGTCEEIKLADSGEFYYPVSAEKAGNIRLVAVDGNTGGVAGLHLSLPRREKSFPDVDGHWAEIDIRHLVSRGMLKGYPDGTFRPDRAVTRVEFTVMLARLMGAGGSGAELPYRDVGDIPRWAKNTVALAHNRGLVGGYEDDTFRPYALITREEAASLLVRACDILKGIPDLPGESPPYADREAISDWARDNVKKARQLGLLTGRSENRFAPRANITRAETAAALNRLLTALTAEE